MSVRVARSSFLQMMLALVTEYVRHMRIPSPHDPAQMRQEAVAQTADSLVGTFPIWQLEASLEIKAYIACWHHVVQPYRGYLLCSDANGRTVVMDMQYWTYVSLAEQLLLQIDGIDETKRFLDALCLLLQPEKQ